VDQPGNQFGALGAGQAEGQGKHLVEGSISHWGSFFYLLFPFFLFFSLLLYHTVAVHPHRLEYAILRPDPKIHAALTGICGMTRGGEEAGRRWDDAM
jgi:hypothetical protein